MSIAGKVATVVAPEAKLAGAVAKAAPAGGAARQRAQIDAIKAKRKPAAQPEQAPAADTAAGPSRTRQALTDQTGSPGWWPSNAEPMKASNTASGAILGAFIWVGVRAYLEGGTLGVRQLLAAKFLNKTGPK